MFDAVWGHNFILVRCPNTLQWRWWFECIDWCRVVPGRTACAFVLLELDRIMGRYLSITMRCPNTLQWQWRLRVDLRLLNAGVGLAMDEQLVRLYCCVYATIWHLLLVLDAIWGRDKFNPYVVLSKKTKIMPMTALRWFSLVNAWVSCWPWANSTCVYL